MTPLSVHVKLPPDRAALGCQLQDMACGPELRTDCVPVQFFAPLLIMNGSGLNTTLIPPVGGAVGSTGTGVAVGPVWPPPGLPPADGVLPGVPLADGVLDGLPLPVFGAPGVPCAAAVRVAVACALPPEMFPPDPLLSVSSPVTGWPE